MTAHNFQNKEVRMTTPDIATRLRESAPDNPHAFPQASVFAGPGMTLRDWFAGQAISGLLASTDNCTAGVFAAKAYFVADAMLAARCATPSQIEEGKDNG